jgi:hypothetical protein
LTPEYLQAYKRKYRIQMMIRASVAAFLMSAAVVSAQGIVTNRMAPTALRGTIVEVTCFRQQGAATVSTPEQIGCAKKRVADGGRLGILTEGDGLFQIAGAFSANKFAKLAPFIGQRVDMSGAEVVISNNYDYRSFDAEKVTKAK